MVPFYDEASLLRLPVFQGPTEFDETDHSVVMHRLWKETGARCVYCGERFGKRSELRTIDHVRPRCLGGGDEMANYAPACAPCNNRKGCQWPAWPLAHPDFAGYVRGKSGE